MQRTINRSLFSQESSPIKTRNMKASTEEQQKHPNNSFFGKTSGRADLSGLHFSEVSRLKILG
jgi:hypothetical protein